MDFHSVSPTLSLFPSCSRTLSLCNFYYYLHLVMRCVFACVRVCVSVSVCELFLWALPFHTHTHTKTLLRGVHSVCNFGASILIDCQTTYGGINEEFKALLTYVNRGLCPELKFIQNCQLFGEFHEHFKLQRGRERERGRQYEAKLIELLIKY